MQDSKDTSRETKSNGAKRTREVRAARRTVDDWSRVLADYSCDEDSDDAQANGMEHVDLVTLQKNAKKVVERMSKLVPANTVPDDLKSAHQKAVNS